MPKLRKISYMNYAGCAIFFLISVISGQNIGLETIIAATGTCTLLIVAGKKGSQSIVQTNKFIDKNKDGVDDKVEELLKKLEERK
jgi:hypothetical protein